MANRRVSVWKYVKVGSRWRYCKPVYGRNHKIKPHWALVNGKPEQHPEGNFYIMRLDGKKKIWRKIGPNPAEATRAAEVEASLMNAIAMGLPIKKEEAVPLEYGPQVWKFLADYKLSQSAESHALMSQTLEEFHVFVKKTNLKEITRADLLKYKQWLVNRERTLRTAGNKMLRVNQFLRAASGLEAGKGLVTVKDAKFTEREPQVYTDDELEAFFAACSEFHSRVFQTLLMAGLRKQEMENLEWPDINFVTGVLSVRGKATFQPKDWEERDIEMPEELREILFAARKQRGFVFCTKSGKKYTHVWDDCKDIAKKIALAEIKRREITDEDEIKQIVEETAAKYHPHKFRATYCTKLLQSGIDLKTVQKLMGHKTIESTMRYLAKAQSHVVKAKVDAVQWKKPVQRRSRLVLTRSPWRRSWFGQKSSDATLQLQFGTPISGPLLPYCSIKPLSARHCVKDKNSRVSKYLPSIDWHVRLHFGLEREGVMVLNQIFPPGCVPRQSQMAASADHERTASSGVGSLTGCGTLGAFQRFH